MQKAFISGEEFWAAAKPLLDLLNVTPLHLYDDEPLTIRGAGDGGVEVSFLKAAEPDSDEPWTLTRVGEGEFQEFAYDVRFHVQDAFGAAMDALWSRESRPEAARVVDPPRKMCEG